MARAKRNVFWRGDATRTEYWYAGLVFASAIGTGWAFFRQEWTGSSYYLFLIWNLFLAWIPFLAATALRYILLHRKSSGLSIFIGTLGLIWLLFLPNAPYLVTDVTHLSRVLWQGFGRWSDIFMMMLFVWLGITLGFLAIYMLQEIVARKTGVLGGWLFAAGSIAVSSFGVYLGRVLRWNSWDVITAPEKVLSEISVLAEPEPYSFIGMMILFSGTVYLLLYMLTLGNKK